MFVCFCCRCCYCQGGHDRQQSTIQVHWPRQVWSYYGFCGLILHYERCNDDDKNDGDNDDDDAIEWECPVTLVFLSEKEDDDDTWRKNSFTIYEQPPSFSISP